MVEDENPGRFIEKYDAYEQDASRYIPYPRHSTEAELREVIAHLIERRRATNRAAVQSLEDKARRLSRELKETERQKLLADLSCFHDILKLHRQLRDDDDQG